MKRRQKGKTEQNVQRTRAGQGAVDTEHAPWALADTLGGSILGIQPLTLRATCAENLGRALGGGTAGLAARIQLVDRDGDVAAAFLQGVGGAGSGAVVDGVARVDLDVHERVAQQADVAFPKAKVVISLIACLLSATVQIKRAGKLNRECGEGLIILRTQVAADVIVSQTLSCKARSKNMHL